MFPYKSYAQQLIDVEGYVYDSLDTPLQGVSIRISPLAQGMPARHAITDTLGRFRIAGIERKVFVLQAQMLGYHDYQTEYHYLPQSSTFKLNAIHLRLAPKLLQGVTVASSAPAIIVREDTIEYRADSFRTKSTDDVEDLLKRIPGMQVKKDGTILAQGQTVTKIKVNGKDFFGSDAQAVAKNLPAEIVDKIQVIDDYGETAAFNGFKTGGSNKIINLQLKKDKSQGHFGNAQVGLGDKGRYNTRLNMNQFRETSQASAFFSANNTASGSLLGSTANYGTLSQLSRSANKVYDQLGGINNVVSMVNNNDLGFATSSMISPPGINKSITAGLNYSMEKNKMSLYGSVLHLNMNNNCIFSSNGIQALDQELLQYTTTGRQQTAYKNTRMFFNMEYRIDSSSLLKYSPVLAIQDNASESEAVNQLMAGNTLLNHTRQQAVQNPDYLSLSHNLIYKKRFRRYGRSILLEGGFSNSTIKQFQSYINTDLLQQVPVSDQRSDNTTKAGSGTFYVNYTEPVFKRALLNIRAGLQVQQNRSRLNLSTFDEDEGKYIPNEDGSGRFYARSILQDYGADLKYLRGKFMITTGAGWQSLTFNRRNGSKQSESFEQGSITPRLSLSYKQTQQRTMQFRYAVSFNAPDSRQLTAIADTINPLLVYRGNPGLKAEIINRFNFTVNDINVVKGGLFLLDAEFQTGQNKIVQHISIDAAGRREITYRNSETAYSTRGFLNYSRPFLNKLLELTIGGSVQYNKSYYATGDSLFPLTTWAYSPVMQVTVNPFTWAELDLSYERQGYGYKTGSFRLTSYSNVFGARMDLSFSSLRIAMDLRRILFNDFLLSDQRAISLCAVSAEKKIGKKFGLKAELNDVFDRSSRNISRSIAENKVTDWRYNAQGRFMLFTISYKFSRFEGVMKQKSVRTE